MKIPWEVARGRRCLLPVPASLTVAEAVSGVAISCEFVEYTVSEAMTITQLTVAK